jgi:hypothetical protein
MNSSLKSYVFLDRGSLSRVEDDSGSYVDDFGHLRRTWAGDGGDSATQGTINEGGIRWPSI